MSEPKRFKRDLTSFEQLPNELFIETFAYLNGVDTVYAFSQLNTRFQSLLIHYVNIFDFKLISKAKFDYVIQHHDIYRWQSLRLSNDDETPGQIRLFCQLYPPYQYISQLQSLSALNMTSKYAQEFVSQLISFDHLVSLEIGNICGENIQSFKLPSLKRLVVTGCKHTAWMMNFHSLESLEYIIEYNCHYNDIFTIPTTVKQLKLLYHETTDRNNMRASLQQLSQLTKLALYDNGSRSSLANGEMWEQLIQSSLPLLKTFQFCFRFHSYNNTPNQIQQAVASFSTPFYLFEKRWFIRCDNDCRYSVTEGILYSLPFAFAQMPIIVTSFNASMSTLIESDIDEAKYESYEKVKTLLFNEKCQMPYRAFLTSNIVRLVLETALPTSWHFLFINLRHLEFRRTLTISSTDFGLFLANTPQLQSLTVPMSVLLKLTDKFTNNTVCDQLSQRIQSLTISQYYSNGDLGTVSIRLLSSLVRIFGKTCEHLSLGLAAHPNTVLPILQRMRQLRSLHIRYRPWCPASHTTAASLIDQPPTKTAVSDFMHASDDYNFYIWFGNRL